MSERTHTASKTPRWLKLASVSVVGLMAFAAFDASASAATKKTTKPKTTKPKTAVPERKQFPALNVTDIASGKPVSLSTLGLGKPTLLWFWAPS